MTSHSGLKADVDHFQSELRKLSRLVSKSVDSMNSLQEIAASLLQASSKVENAAALTIRDMEQQDVLGKIRKPVAVVTSVEKGTLCLHLKASGWQDEEIASKTGYTIKHIQDFCKMTELPPSVQALIASGRVSVSLAFKTMRRHPDDGEAILAQAAKYAISGTNSPDEVEA